MAHLVQMKVVLGTINLQFCACANAQMLLLPYIPKFSENEVTGQNSICLFPMELNMMKLSMSKPCRQTHFYPELNLYVGFGSWLCTKSENGCEEDKELITNTCNCFDMLHSKGNGFAETWPDSCITFLQTCN